MLPAHSGGVGRLQHTFAFHFLDEAHLAPVLDQPQFGKGTQAGQRFIDLLDLPGSQDSQRSVQSQGEEGVCPRGSLCLLHSATPFDQGLTMVS